MEAQSDCTVCCCSRLLQSLATNERTASAPSRDTYNRALDAALPTKRYPSSRHEPWVLLCRLHVTRMFQVLRGVCVKEPMLNEAWSGGTIRPFCAICSLQTAKWYHFNVASCLLPAWFFAGRVGVLGLSSTSCRSVRTRVSNVSAG